MKKKVIAVVVTFNGSTWICNCLKSIKNSSILIDVICVDNLSSDNTVDKIKREFPKVILVEGKNNLGFGQANNIGLKYALDNNFDFVFLLNQDAFVEENTIEKLIEVSFKYPEFGILSPIHLNGEGTNLDLNFSNYINEISCKGLISDSFLRKKKKEVYDLPFVNAAAWLLPIETLKKIGGFDPIFFHYGEDDNYCQRVLFHGLKVGIVPESIIYHDRDQSFKYPYLFHDLNTFNRIVKPSLADINKNFNLEFKKQKRDLDAFIFFSLVDFKLKRVLKLLKFRSHLIRMKSEIKKSIQENKKIGPNYLNEPFDLYTNTQLQ